MRRRKKASSKYQHSVGSKTYKNIFEKVDLAQCEFFNFLLLFFFASGCRFKAVISMLLRVSVPETRSLVFLVEKRVLAQRTYIPVPRLLQCLSPRQNWVPQPLSLKRVCPPRNQGGHTRLRVRGWGGGSHFRRLEKKPSNLSTQWLQVKRGVSFPDRLFVLCTERKAVFVYFQKLYLTVSLNVFCAMFNLTKLK